MRFDTKIAVVVREDLPTWQKLNMTAFLVSGIAARQSETTGENYVDGSGNIYLPMFRQPVLVFTGPAAAVRAAYERAMERKVKLAIFTEALFGTGNDVDNRAAVMATSGPDLKLAGMAFHADRKLADKILKGLSLHP
ncbi:MAG TPA: DUF2000 family protein [Stellaceae bacterium]|nr:DUF2000 family protein [Stellaceae bacterium]